MMRTRLGVALTGLVLVAGCSHDSSKTSSSDTRSGATPAAARTTTPDNLPTAISTVFRREHPDAGITNITPSSAETGAPIYRITFIENGQPGSATYFQNGERLPQPPPTNVAPGTPRAVPQQSGGTSTTPPAR